MIEDKEEIMSQLITWDQVIKNAFRMYHDRDKYAYFYDCKGSVLTDPTMDYLINLHPEHFSKYSPAEIQRIKDYSRGKIGYDCSGFIWAVTEHTIGGSANGIYKNAPKKYGNTIDNPAGSMLWLSGHIGLDIGYGEGFSMDSEGGSINLHNSRSYPWTDAALFVTVDYTGADSR